MVKRYFLWHGDSSVDNPAEMHTNETGDYVSYDDYEKLESELAATKANRDSYAQLAAQNQEALDASNKQLAMYKDNVVDCNSLKCPAEKERDELKARVAELEDQRISYKLSFESAVIDTRSLKEQIALLTLENGRLEKQLQEDHLRLSGMIGIEEMRTIEAERKSKIYKSGLQEIIDCELSYPDETSVMKACARQALGAALHPEGKQ